MRRIAVAALAALVPFTISLTQPARADVIYLCDDKTTVTVTNATPERLEMLKKTNPCVRAFHERLEERQKAKVAAAQAKAQAEAEPASGPISTDTWRELAAQTAAEDKSKTEAKEKAEAKDKPAEDTGRRKR